MNSKKQIKSVNKSTTVITNVDATCTSSGDLLVYDATAIIAPIIQVIQYDTGNSIKFNGPGGEELGKLYEKDGQLHFEGDVSDSAKIFMDYIMGDINGRIDELAGVRKKSLIKDYIKKL